MAQDSRAGEIEAQRDRKARELQPDELSAPERVLQTVKRKRIVERITGGTAGVRLHLGGLTTGAGFGFGPEYYRRLNHDRIIIRSSLRASFSKFYVMDAGVTLPRLASDRAFLSFLAAYRNFPRMDYYGPGPDSRKSGRSAYAFEEGSFEARGGVRFLERLGAGVLGRYQRINVGPGRDDRFASSETVYPAAAGIDTQSDYVAAGAFVYYDWRDNPGGPRGGGFLEAQFTNYSPRGLSAAEFRRIDLDAQHYIGFTNRRRVIALRARAAFTAPRAGGFVPFYLQPRLGGSDTLRGFRAWRFYDNNAAVFNAEYRWEVFSGFDMALFADYGEVFHRVSDFRVSNLEQSYGFGLRFNIRNEVFLRMDTGFSREGFQLWFKFNNVF